MQTTLEDEPFFVSIWVRKITKQLSWCMSLLKTGLYVIQLLIYYKFLFITRSVHLFMWITTYFILAYFLKTLQTISSMAISWIPIWPTLTIQCLSWITSCLWSLLGSRIKMMISIFALWISIMAFQGNVFNWSDN